VWKHFEGVPRKQKGGHGETNAEKKSLKGAKTVKERGKKRSRKSTTVPETWERERGKKKKVVGERAQPTSPGNGALAGGEREVRLIGKTDGDLGVGGAYGPMTKKKGPYRRKKKMWSTCNTLLGGMGEKKLVGGAKKKAGVTAESKFPFRSLPKGGEEGQSIRSGCGHWGIFTKTEKKRKKGINAKRKKNPSNGMLKIAQWLEATPRNAGRTMGCLKGRVKS